LASVPEALDANAQPLLTMDDQKNLQKRHQEDQRQIKMLQQELRRKDRALAEAAALLIASKKIQAYWGEDEGDFPQQQIAAWPWRSSMPLLRPERGPIRWPSCWTWGLPPCSAGGGSSPVLGTDWIAEKAATALCLTV
jgi:hypothetical protein